MKAFTAFFGKELLETKRSGKLLLLGILFLAFGIMNPAIAKLTPWLLETMAADLAESGMTITEVTVDAMTSWTQFFKNIPMALIAFVLLYSGIFTKEYESNTLILMLTKGLARYKVLLSKLSVMLLLWTGGYWLCFGVTYGYTAYYWDNGVAANLIGAVTLWWLFGVFTVCLMVLFSVIARSYSMVLLGTGGSVFALYLLGMLPKAAKLTPTALMEGMHILTGAQVPGDYSKAVIITVVAGTLCVTASIPILNKKQL